MNMNPEMLERAKLTGEGMAQFELLHAPARVPAHVIGRGVKDGEKAEEELADFLVVCRTCRTDFPCERMGIMLIVQAMAMLQSMIPSGNMAGMLSRFAGGGKQ